jgi:hypothetical protein
VDSTAKRALVGRKLALRMMVSAFITMIMNYIT